MKMESMLEGFRRYSGPPDQSNWGQLTDPVYLINLCICTHRFPNCGMILSEWLLQHRASTQAYTNEHLHIDPSILPASLADQRCSYRWVRPLLSAYALLNANVEMSIHRLCLDLSLCYFAFGFLFGLYVSCGISRGRRDMMGYL